MGKPASLQVRFAVRAPDGRRSSVWFLWKHKQQKRSDLFLATHNLAGTLKISFHEYGYTHEAFTDEFFERHQDKPGMPATRTRTKWPRQDNTVLGVACLYRLFFPHSELRDWPLEPGLFENDIVWVAAAENARVTEVVFLLVRPNEPEVYLEGYAPTTPWPLVHWFLPSNENLLVLPHGKDLTPQILAEAQRVANDVPTGTPVPAPTASSRMVLSLVPVDNVGGTLDVAWPCTIIPPEPVPQAPAPS